MVQLLRAGAALASNHLFATLAVKQTRSSAVKRPYSSPTRAQSADRTRRAIVAAATRLYVADGYGATTIDAIAAAAGVSRKTIFNSVGGKLDLLKLSIDWATVGDGQSVALLERPEIRRIAALSDGVLILREWSVLTTSMSARLAELSVVLFVASGIDPEAKALRERTQAQRYSGASALVSHLSEQAGLGRGIDADTATDLLWLYSDPLIYYRLVHERGWTQLRFQAWLERATTTQLL